MSTNNENKTHPHAALIKAWAEGAEIQYFNEHAGDCGEWRDVTNNTPLWDVTVQYRIKPEENEPWKPKKDELEALKIDTTLSDGELALIRALREANVVEAFKFQKTRLITEDNHRLYTYDKHVAFLTNNSEAVIAALKQIQEEQEASNEA